MEPEKSDFSKYIRVLWIAYGTGVVAIILLFWLISTGALGFMPSFEDLENPQSQVASQIITSDNQVLGK
jgi:penicillin-binding protein 1A